MAPIPRTCVGWIVIERLQTTTDDAVPATNEPVAATPVPSAGMSSDGRNARSIIRTCVTARCDDGGIDLIVRTHKDGFRNDGC